MADSTPISATATPTRSPAEWERAARELLDEGQNFLAHDTAREGLRQYPDNFKLAIFGAVALSQTGALDEARKLLQPVLDVILIDEGPFHRLHSSLKRAVETLGDEPGKDTLGTMAELAEALELVRGKKLVATADSDTLTALAGVFREAWLASGSRRDLEHCRELYLRAFQISHAPRDGVDAAVAAWLLGDHDAAREQARRVSDRMSAAETDLSLSPEQRFQLLATLAEAHLLQGETSEAIASFAWASTLEGIHYGVVVSALKQLSLLQDGGLDVPDAIFDVIKPPTVAVFTGHPLDRPGEGPHFPPELESAVRTEIARSLDELGAQVGYSMAACGSDLLFIEAMLERGAEVNVVMPYAIDDFIAENVRYGGSRWEMRFRNALKLANTVTYATEERYLGHDMLYRFANQCLHGLATLRATFLRTAPYLLAVWDMMPGSLVGGAADFIDQWEDISRLRIIDLDSLLQQRPEFAGDSMPSLPDMDGDDEQGEGRVIRSMMFCDIAGYSKLKEEHTPVFLDFLRMISDGMNRLGTQPIAINTWGDAIFVVMDKATPLAEYAQTLQEMVQLADEALADRLPHPLSLRISLHAGPVFQATDPICGRQNFYGSHINRAARLEPVTVIGHVYATQQFVAVLTAEQSALRSEAQNRGDEFVERFACEYVGVLSLAKDFGKQAVYHLRRRVAPSLEDVEDPALTLDEVETEALIHATLERDAALSDDDEMIGGSQALETMFSSDDMDALLAETTEAAEPLGTDGFSESDLLALAAEAEVEPEPEPLKPLVFGTVMSDDDIAALLAESEDTQSDLPGIGAPLSDDDLAAILADAGPVEEDQDDLPELGTALSDDDLAAILADTAPVEETEDDLPEIGTALSDDDLAAILADAAPVEESEDDLPEIGAALSDDDLAAILADTEPVEEMDAPADMAPILGTGPAMSDDDIAALLAESDDGESDDTPSPGFSGVISEADMAAMLAEAEPDDAPLDPDMAEVAAAVQAAMAKLDADDRAADPLADDISLAPPRRS